ncbi:hypothetical protein EDC04DRAFT_2805266 [Pisolithus marmoratus]|nr:hypothetical protein EDC04DRAFT_2805266 [Pisolithus marmoratus]
MMAVVLGTLSLLRLPCLCSQRSSHTMNVRRARRNEAAVQQHGVSIVHSSFFFWSAYQSCNNTTFQHYATFVASEKVGLVFKHFRR